MAVSPNFSFYLPDPFRSREEGEGDEGCTGLPPASAVTTLHWLFVGPPSSTIERPEAYQLQALHALYQRLLARCHELGLAAGGELAPPLITPQGVSSTRKELQRLRALLADPGTAPAWKAAAADMARYAPWAFQSVRTPRDIDAALLSAETDLNNEERRNTPAARAAAAQRHNNLYRYPYSSSSGALAATQAERGASLRARVDALPEELSARILATPDPDDRRSRLRTQVNALPFELRDRIMGYAQRAPPY